MAAEQPEQDRPTPDNEKLKTCPECGGPVQYGSGCVACIICGWGYCG